MDVEEGETNGGYLCLSSTTTLLQAAQGRLGGSCICSAAAAPAPARPGHLHRLWCNLHCDHLSNSDLFFLFCLLRTCFDVCGDCLFDGRLMTYFQLWRIKGSVSSAPKTLGTWYSLFFLFFFFFYTVFFLMYAFFCRQIMILSFHSKWFLCIKLHRINGSDEFCMTMTSFVVFPKCSGDVVVCFYVAKVRDN